MSGFLYLITLILVPWLIVWVIADPDQRGVWWPFDMKNPAATTPRPDAPGAGAPGTEAPRIGTLGPRIWGRPGETRTRDMTPARQWDKR